jgi:hypothetical protein
MLYRELKKMKKKLNAPVDRWSQLLIDWILAL